MRLNPKIYDAVVKILEEGEGNVSHFYLCTEGKLTVGIGKMIPSVDKIDSIRMLKSNESEATNQEKRDEYMLIKSKPFGDDYPAKYYKQFTKLHADVKDIYGWLQEAIQSFHSQCRMLFRKENGFHANYDDFPAALQLALFDLLYNLGLSGLRDGFPSFLQAVKEQNWQVAAKESKRKNPGLELRNEKIKQLFYSLGPGEQLAFPDVKRKFMCALFAKQER